MIRVLLLFGGGKGVTSGLMKWKFLINQSTNRLANQDACLCVSNSSMINSRHTPISSDHRSKSKRSKNEFHHYQSIDQFNFCNLTFE